jgi:hypothetical protein
MVWVTRSTSDLKTDGLSLSRRVTRPHALRVGVGDKRPAVSGRSRVEPNGLRGETGIEAMASEAATTV